MKLKLKNKIFFIVFMLIWIILIIFNFVFPKKNFSEQENRNLASFPKFSFEKLLSGQYQEELDTYINDHFIFRDIWIKIKSTQETLLGKTENNNVYVGKDGYLFEKFDYGETEIRNLQTISQTVNKFADNLDIPVYFLLAPNSIYINREKLPEYAQTYNQEIIINNFYNNLNDKIVTINVIPTIEENKNEYLYFKTDHHMTSDGAYLLYREFNNTKEIETQSLSRYNKKIVSNSFLGTFDSKAQMVNQEADTIAIYQNENNTNLKEVVYDNETTKSIYNEEYLNQKDKYSYFLNGNNAKVVVKTNVENNKKLLVIKDSYAHIMAQFLCNEYEEIHFVDPRYYKMPLSEYIENENIDEALFLYNVSNLVTDVGIRTIR